MYFRSNRLQNFCYLQFDMMTLSLISIINFNVIFFGYLSQSMLLEYLFYYRQAKHTKSWKTQPQKDKWVGVMWGFPIISNKGDRAPYHRYLTFINLLIASAFACAVSEFCIRGKNYMHFTSAIEYGYMNIIKDLVVAIVHENIVEYYWHRLMHLRFFYQKFHKLHHFYKSPEPFDDMYIHPLEAFGYYCILYSPPFIYNCHLYSFLMYMIFMGICGIMDHSGIRAHIPGIYNTVDHDMHHALFDVNYGFPFIYMDILHNTFEGNLLGWQFRVKNVRNDQKCN